MSRLTRARIVRKEAAAGAPPIFAPGPSAEQRARLSAEEVMAHQNADRVIDMALTRSQQIVDTARAAASAAATEAAHRAEEEEQTQLAAAWLGLRDVEERRAARELDGTIALAQVIAERLIGRAVALDPTVVSDLARGALAEARVSRPVRIEAHPLDVALLRESLAELGTGGTAEGGVLVDYIENAELARGSLCVHTDLGTLDARLHTRIERLAAALRDALNTP